MWAQIIEKLILIEVGLEKTKIFDSIQQVLQICFTLGICKIR